MAMLRCRALLRTNIDALSTPKYQTLRVYSRLWDVWRQAVPGLNLQTEWECRQKALPLDERDAGGTGGKIHCQGGFFVPLRPGILVQI